jgi:hypothetical protein
VVICTAYQYRQVHGVAVDYPPAKSPRNDKNLRQSTLLISSGSHGFYPLLQIKRAGEGSKLQFDEVSISIRKWSW